MTVPAIVYPDTVITRRDFFAAHALNGLLQKLYSYQPDRLDYIVNESVRLADDLMRKLDEME
jgi:hypothetical protein